MKNKIFIEGLYLSKQEINFPDFDKFNVDIISTEIKGFVDVGTVYVMLHLAQNVSFSAVYDVLKHTLLVITSKISRRESNTIEQEKVQMIEMTYNGVTESLKTNMELNDEQKTKIIDAFLSKFQNTNEN